MLLTTVKLLVDAPLPGATYDTVPPPPLSTDPGASLIAAGAAAKEKLVSLLLDWGF
jgi:hypothetical protein